MGTGVGEFKCREVDKMCYIIDTFRAASTSALAYITPKAKGANSGRKRRIVYASYEHLRWAGQR